MQSPDEIVERPMVVDTFTAHVDSERVDVWAHGVTEDGRPVIVTTDRVTHQVWVVTDADAAWEQLTVHPLVGFPVDRMILPGGRHPEEEE